MNIRPNQAHQYLNEYNRVGPASISRLGQSNRRSMQNDQNFGEIQFMLENQRKKFREAKEKFQYDLDMERKSRIQFQNKLIKMKDEFSRKEVTISQLQFKINNLLHHNQDLSLENQRLNSQLSRLESVYGGKIHQLQSQLAIQVQNFKQMQSQYNTQFEKFKKEGQQYVESLQFEYERKIKNLDEKLKQIQLINRDLVLENKKIQDTLISNKLAFQEEVRDLKNKFRDQDAKKIQSLNKSFQQKLRLMDEAKETLSKRNSQLMRTLQDKDRQIQEMTNYHQQQMRRIQRDNADSSQKINQLNFLLNKLKSQLGQKDNQISRHSSGNEQELRQLRQQIEQKKQQISQMSSTIRDLRSTLKQSEVDAQRRRKQIVQKCSYFESESRKYKEQYQRICQILKSRINQTINNVTFKK